MRETNTYKISTETVYDDEQAITSGTSTTTATKTTKTKTKTTK